MSLTSYRTAPPRVTSEAYMAMRIWEVQRREKGRAGPLNGAIKALTCEWVNRNAPAAMPGGDLLFQSLSTSTIGAVRFHGRVRDGIGWVTDAMATKQ